jgi:hypothetical protein
MADLPTHLEARANRYLLAPLDLRLAVLGDLVRSAKYRTQAHQHGPALDEILVVEHVLDMSLREVRAARATMERADA